MVLEAETVPMYVLTNRQRLNGACCILYQDVLKQVAGRLGDSLYILPSSIHEVIAIPASASGNPKELSQLVQEINIAEVAPEEIHNFCLLAYAGFSWQTPSVPAFWQGIVLYFLAELFQNSHKS